MSGKELETTHRYEVGDYPPGTKMLMASRTDLDAAIRAGEIKAVGRFRQLDGGMSAVPAVYLARRHLPFHVRHKVALIISGSVLTLAAGVTAIVMTVGLGWFVAGVALMALTIATLVRYSQGGGRHRVSVTTTTTTNVRVR